jgi:hypothetical protein
MSEQHGYKVSMESRSYKRKAIFGTAHTAETADV